MANVNKERQKVSFRGGLQRVQIGKQECILVSASAAAAISANDPVSVHLLGDGTLVANPSASAEAHVVGLAQAAITSGGGGYVVVSGKVTNAKVWASAGGAAIVTGSPLCYAGTAGFMMVATSAQQHAVIAWAGDATATSASDLTVFVRSRYG